MHDLQLIEVELKDEELESNIVDAMALEVIAHLTPHIRRAYSALSTPSGSTLLDL